MKILKIIHGYPPEYNAGSEVYSQSICDELSKRNEVFVFTREENEYRTDFKFRKEFRDDKQFCYVNMPRGKDGYNHDKVNQRFGDFLEDIQPEVAHIGHLNHLSIGIVKELTDRKIPILYTLHDFWLMCPRGQFLQRNFDGEQLYTLCEKQDDSKCADQCYSMYYSNTACNNDKDYWIGWVNKRMADIKEIIQHIDLFHAPSQYLMDRYIYDFNIAASKIFYLDYGFPTHYLQPVNECNSEEFTFGYIGTHIPAKGINMLIEAFGKVKGKTRLKIFGRELGQNTKALKTMAAKIENPVEFCGEYINKNLAETVFSNIHCIVVPSIWGENSPLVIHEAQACKIPVITADFGGMKEYVAHKENGLLFKHRDDSSLTEHMQFAIDNRKLMVQFGKRGYLYSENGNVQSIEEHCLRLEEIYNQIIRNNG